MNAKLTKAYADYDSAGAHKLLSPQRDAQFEQSRRTVNGLVADFLMPEQPKREPKTQLRLFVFRE